MSDFSATTQRFTAGAPAFGQSAKEYVGSVSTSTTLTTTVTLETVTAGKTFYITDMAIFTASSAAVDGSVQAAGVKIFAFGTSTTAPVQMAGLETQPFATAGQSVTLVIPPTTAATTIWYNILGYEQ